jgi:hypothetical protein
LELVHDFANLLKATNAPTQLRQLRQGGVGTATAIEQTVNFLHDLSQRSQLRQATRDGLERSTFRRCQIVLDEEITMFEEVGDFLLQALSLAGRVFGLRRRWPPTLRGSLAFGQSFSHLGRGSQDRLGQFFDDVELADLMGHIAEHYTQRLGIQGRTVGCDTLQLQAAQLHCHSEPAEESGDVSVVGIVIEHLEEEPLEGAIVDDGQDAKRAIV